MMAYFPKSQPPSVLGYLYAAEAEDPNKLDAYRYPIAKKEVSLPSREQGDYLMSVAEVINQNMTR